MYGAVVDKQNAENYIGNTSLASQKPGIMCMAKLELNFMHSSQTAKLAFSFCPCRQNQELCARKGEK